MEQIDKTDSEASKGGDRGMIDEGGDARLSAMWGVSDEHLS